MPDNKGLKQEANRTLKKVYCR